MIATLAFCPAGVFAQSCPVTLPTSGSPESYRFRPSVPRCEGTFTQPVSGGSGFSLVSLTFGPVAYQPGRDRELHIRLSEGATVETKVQGVGLPLQRYYRLDATLNAQRRELRIPLEEVITRAGIGPSELGIFGLRPASATSSGYVPVFAAAPSVTAANAIRAIIRPGSNVTGVRWRLVVPGNAPPDYLPVDNGAGFVPEGTTLSINLPRDLPAPRTTLEVAFFATGVPDTNRFILLKP